nr:hypothetical protein CFP56_34936 [Quercus suber]
MVAFKNLLLGATVLLGGVAAAPSQSKNLNMLQKRALFETMDANNICENEYVLPATISDNNGAATVVDLTGCTAVFFYLEDEDSGTPTLRYAYHIQCGIEATDGQTAAQMSPGVDTAVIAATSSDTYETTKAAIMAGRPTITNFIFQIYSKENIPTGQGVTFTATSGTTNIVQGLKDIRGSGRKSAVTVGATTFVPDNLPFRRDEDDRSWSQELRQRPPSLEPLALLEDLCISNNIDICKVCETDFCSAVPSEHQPFLFCVALFVHLGCHLSFLPSMRGNRVGRVLVVTELCEFDGVHIDESHVVWAGLVFIRVVMPASDTRRKVVGNETVKHDARPRVARLGELRRSGNLLCTDKPCETYDVLRSGTLRLNPTLSW